MKTFSDILSYNDIFEFMLRAVKMVNGNKFPQKTFPLIKSNKKKICAYIICSFFFFIETNLLFK